MLHTKMCETQWNLTETIFICLLAQLLYWCDYRTHSIHSLDLESDRRVVLDHVDIEPPVSSSSCTMVHHDGMLYFTFSSTDRLLWKK